MPRKAPPAYRKRIIRGREVAIVTLSDVVTKRRRDFYLGLYGTPESRERYACLLAQWESGGRRLPAASDKPKGPTLGWRAEE